MVTEPKRFDPPWLRRALIAAGLAALLTLLGRDAFEALDSKALNPLRFAGLVVLFVLYAAVNLVVADLGRRRAPVTVLLISLFLGTFVAMEAWNLGSRPAGRPGSGDTPLLLLLACWVSFGAILGARLVRDGPQRRARRVAIGLASAVLGVIFPAVVCYFVYDRRPLEGMGHRAAATVLVVLLELAFWLPVSLAEEAGFRFAKRG
jgi:hypothetical protein